MSEPVARSRLVTTLRLATALLLCRGLLPGLRSRLGVALGRLGCAQAALQVVEGQADCRLRRGRRGDHEVAFAEDEDAALRRGGLELDERARRGGAGFLGGGQE